MDALASHYFVGSIVASAAVLAAGVYVLYGSPWDNDSDEGSLIYTAK